MQTGCLRGAGTRRAHDGAASIIKTKRDIKQINSKESEILQITDLFIGALGFKNRKIKNLNAKSEIVEYIESKYQIKMNKKTSRNEEKFNIFIWEPRK